MFLFENLVAGQLGVKTQQVTLAIGESISIKVFYGFFVIVSNAATAALIGVLAGSSVTFIHQMSASNIRVEKGDSWGYLKITNNGDEELTFNVHLFV